MSKRITQTFAQLKAQKRGGLITFITAGDPDYQTSLAILHKLPEKGADLIELGLPFSDPMADGPAIQEASQRALAQGMTTAKTLEMVTDFRKTNHQTPIILMGYYNPLLAFGIDEFAKASSDAGVDGLIVVDLPPEEANELKAALAKYEIDLIFLITPTTDEARLDLILNLASGFVYYVSIAGVTGTLEADKTAVKEAVERIKKHTSLPVAVGFGIKTPAAVKNIAKIADAAVVGSAIVNKIASAQNKNREEILTQTIDFVEQLAKSIDKA